MEEERHYLVHMSQSVGRILKYAEGGRSDFLASVLVQHAVMWNLALIANAVKRVSAEQRGLHPEVDWHHLSDLCAGLMHDPWEYQPEKVWQCIEDELPRWRHELRGILVASHLK